MLTVLLALILAVNAMPPTYSTTAYAPFAPTGTEQFFRINNGKNTGPYFWNGFYYASGFFSDSNITTYARLAVYKSADGVTWTPVDQAHWPYVTWASEFYSVAGGSVISFCYFNGDYPAGAITGSALNNPGAGYVNNDTGTVNGGTLSATYRVIVSGGVVTAVVINVQRGGGYSVASNVGTTAGGSQPGVGTGLTIDITQIGGSPGGGSFTPTLQNASFDMATGLFTTISTAGPTLSLNWNGPSNGYEPPFDTSANPSIELQFMIRSDGVWVIEYGTINAISGFFEVDMVTWNGATWGSPALVSSTGNPNNTGFEPYGMGLTPTDQAYMLWLNGDDDNLYFSLYHGSTLDAPALAFTFGSHDFVMPRGPWSTQAYYDASIDSLIWNFSQRVPFDTTWEVGLLVASTASTSAVFSVVDTGGRADRTGTRGTMAFVKFSGTYYAYYVSLSQILPSNTAQISVASAASLAGPWSAPSLFWDFPAVNSYSPAPAAFGIFDQIAYLTISVLANGPAFTIYPEITSTGPGAGAAGSGAQFILDPAAPPSTPPPTNPGDGGRKPTVLAPNQFDFCLHREYRLFCNIDYNLKGCARLPACFRVDEREWGDQG